MKLNLKLQEREGLQRAQLCQSPSHRGTDLPDEVGTGDASIQKSGFQQGSPWGREEKWTLTLGTGEMDRLHGPQLLFLPPSMWYGVSLCWYIPVTEIPEGFFQSWGTSHGEEVAPLGLDNRNERLELQVPPTDALAKRSLWQREALSTQGQPSFLLDCLPLDRAARYPLLERQPSAS